jgi:hypothetical protein
MHQFTYSDLIISQQLTYLVNGRKLKLHNLYIAH